MLCLLSSAFCLFFFFQAEDGIRDADVTGVQTCALPILIRILHFCRLTRGFGEGGFVLNGRNVEFLSPTKLRAAVATRSEERRVGKECRCRWSRDVEKKQNKGSVEETK